VNSAVLDPPLALPADKRGIRRVGHGAHNVLLLENDTDTAEMTAEYLVLRGDVTVWVAATAAAATAIVADHKWLGAIVDVRLEEADRSGSTAMQGDTWLTKHIDILRGARVAVVTAYPNRMVQLERLKALRVPVIEKSSDDELQFYNELMASSRDNVKGRIGDARARRDDTAHEYENMIVERARRILLYWLRELPDEENESVWVGRREYRIVELRAAVREGRPEGVVLVNMLLRRIEDMLGVPGGAGD